MTSLPFTTETCSRIEKQPPIRSMSSQRSPAISPQRGPRKATSHHRGKCTSSFTDRKEPADVRQIPHRHPRTDAELLELLDPFLSPDHRVRPRTGRHPNVPCRVVTHQPLPPGLRQRAAQRGPDPVHRRRRDQPAVTDLLTPDRVDSPLHVPRTQLVQPVTAQRGDQMLLNDAPIVDHRIGPQTGLLNE